MLDYLNPWRPVNNRRRRPTWKHNYHHLLAYDLNDAAGGATFADSTAYVDQSFSQRNGHYIFSEDYQIVASAVIGASAVDSRLNMPSINAIAYHHFWGVNRSATVPTPLVIEDLRSSPLVLPRNEEMSVQQSDNAVAAVHQETFVIITPPNWNQNLPAYLKRLSVKATATINTGAYAWSGLTPLVFESTLKGGWYSVVGCEGEGANLLAYQLNFPRFPLIQGRKLYPGWLSLNAVGNYPVFYDRAWLGLWGTFFTFEPPQVQGVSAAGGNIAATFYLDLLYHGETPPAGSIS